MSDNNHPITPPPELVIEWWNQCTVTSDNLIRQFATQAARWGADQELDACCSWLKGTAHIGIDFELINARRPKPPSLKEKALEAIDALEGFKGVDIIRQALESLPD